MPSQIKLYAMLYVCCNRVKDYDDYNMYSDSFKSNLVYHALVGLRAVLATHLHHRSGTPPMSLRGELQQLHQQCATVACTLLQGGRSFDQELKVGVEAVRLLLTCGRGDPALFATAYHVR